MSPRKVAKKLNPEWVRQGATLKALREARGITVAEFAAKLGHSDSYLRNIEDGRRRLTPPLVAKSAGLLGVRTAALVRPDEFQASA